MRHATLLLCILRERRVKSLFLVITSNKPGDIANQRWEMSHYNVTDIILPCFIILPMRFILFPPRSVALSLYIVHVPHNHRYTSGTAASLRPALSSLFSKQKTAVLLTILCLLHWLIPFVSFGVRLLVCTGLFLWLLLFSKLCNDVSICAGCLSMSVLGFRG
jgi:hypothetical protein